VTAIQEILSDLRHEVTADGEILLDKLVAELRGDAWLPDRMYETAVEVFGEQFHNRRARSRVALSRLAQHALRVWSEKYGPLNAQQSAYADDVLSAALRSARRDAEGDTGKLFRFAQAQIGRMVNHERVHEGFRSRAGLVEVGDVLAEVA